MIAPPQFTGVPLVMILVSPDTKGKDTHLWQVSLFATSRSKLRILISASIVDRTT